MGLRYPPGFRRYRIAERLVKYLLEVECRSDPRIKQFLLWVFDKNFYAIKLYQRMGFEPTGIKKESLERAGLIEIQYRLSFENVVIATDPVVNEAARQHDLREYGVHYRLLGEDFRVVEFQFVKGALDRSTLGKIGEMTSPLDQVSLPQVDELLTEFRPNPIQLLLCGTDGYLSGPDVLAPFRCSGLVQGVA